MKSVEQHKRDGTYQPCRHADRGTSVPKVEGLACPPTITDKRAKQLWKQQVGALCENGLVTIVDAPILEDAYYCYSKAMECRDAIEKKGSIDNYYAGLEFHEKDLGAEYRHWMLCYHRALYKFGMTPVEASKVRTNVNKDDDGTDFLKSLMGNG